MTAKELLQPRFEVIAEYPRAMFQKGEILHRITRATYDVFHTDTEAPVGGLEQSELEKYPHLFRKMNWWELREASQMPRKIKCLAFPEQGVYEIKEWDMDSLFGYIDEDKHQGCSLPAFKPEYGYLPVD